jgi:hypothetical protein
MRTSRTPWILATLCAVSSIAVAAPPPRAERHADDFADLDELDAADELDDDALDPLDAAVAGPSIGAVLAAAYATARLDHDPTRSWARRTRLAGLVPWITVRTTRDTSWQDAQAEVGHGATLELRATWRLDRLVFDGHELQITGAETARRRERRQLASRVIRAYFAWRRAATAGERAELRAAELAAELDALTDGWFSDEVSRLRWTTGGPRGERSAPR